MFLAPIELCEWCPFANVTMTKFDTFNMLGRGGTTFFFFFLLFLKYLILALTTCHFEELRNPDERLKIHVNSYKCPFHYYFTKTSACVHWIFVIMKRPELEKTLVEGREPCCPSINEEPAEGSTPSPPYTAKRDYVNWKPKEEKNYLVLVYIFYILKGQFTHQTYGLNR